MVINFLFTFGSSSLPPKKDKRSPLKSFKKAFIILMALHFSKDNFTTLFSNRKSLLYARIGIGWHLY